MKSRPRADRNRAHLQRLQVGGHGHQAGVDGEAVEHAVVEHQAGDGEQGPGVLLAAAATAYAAPNPVSGPKPSGDGYQTAAAHAILIDAESGSVLFEKAADELIPPASLSKLMTAEVVFNEIKQGRLKPTTEFVVSTNAWRRGGAPRS